MRKLLTRGILTQPYVKCRFSDRRDVAALRRSRRRSATQGSVTVALPPFSFSRRNGVECAEGEAIESTREDPQLGRGSQRQPNAVQGRVVIKCSKGITGRQRRIPVEHGLRPASLPAMQ